MGAGKGRVKRRKEGPDLKVLHGTIKGKDSSFRQKRPPFVLT